MTPPLDSSVTARWQRALADAVQRLQDERGVTESWGLSTEYGHLWAHYGELGVRVAGEDPDVLRPEDLFDEIDTWVAFDRCAGPGRVLERDRQAIADWRAAAPGMSRVWEQVGARVFADVEATTDIRWAWRVAVHEDEISWPRPGTGLSGLWLSTEPVEPVRRQLAFPQLWLELAQDWGTSLPRPGDDLEAATARVAEYVQDAVIDEVHGAWPVCPGHPHPMELGTSHGTTVWRCPKDTDVAERVGELSGSGPPLSTT